MHLYLFCLHTLTPRVPPLRGGGRDPGGSTLTDLVIQLPFNILSLLVLHLLLLLLLVLLSVRILLRVFLFYLLCVCVFAAETYLYPMFAAERHSFPASHTHYTRSSLAGGAERRLELARGRSGCKYSLKPYSVLSIHPVYPSLRVQQQEKKSLTGPRAC